MSGFRASRLKVEMRRQRRAALVLLAGLIGGVVAAALLIAQMNVSLPWSDDREIRVAVDDAKGVVAGRQELRWAGVVVGRITDVELDGGRAILTATVDSDDEIYRDATMRLRPQTALEDMYLDVESRGTPAAGVLGDGDVLSAERTRTPVHVGDVLAVLDEDARGHLDQLIAALATGLPDGGTQLRASFAEVAPFVGAATELVDVLERRTRLVRELVHDTRLVVDELADRERDVATLVSAGATTFGETGAKAGAIDATLAELPPTLDVLRTSMGALRGTLGEVRPALDALGPAARAAPDGLEALEALSRGLTPALAATRPAVRALRPLARDLAPTAGALAAAFERLDPQVPALRRVAEKVTPCELAIQKFFAYTLSTMKLGNKDNRSASPRGILVAAAADAAIEDPTLRPTIGCADGKEAGS